jgi:hypothetical protein
MGHGHVHGHHHHGHEHDHGDVAAAALPAAFDASVPDEALTPEQRSRRSLLRRAGLLGAAVDPAGPAIDVVGDADPWRDLWFYSNPVWVLPA